MPISTDLAEVLVCKRKDIELPITFAPGQYIILYDVTL